MKYIRNLYSHIKKKVILFYVKAFDEACKKAMYIKGKDGKNSTNGTSSLRWKERRGLEEK
jgi:hypothetical protein